MNVLLIIAYCMKSNFLAVGEDIHSCVACTHISVYILFVPLCHNDLQVREHHQLHVLIMSECA